MYICGTMAKFGALRRYTRALARVFSNFRRYTRASARVFSILADLTRHSASKERGQNAYFHDFLRIFTYMAGSNTPFGQLEIA